MTFFNETSCSVSALNTYTSSSIMFGDISTGDNGVNITTSSGNITIDACQVR